MYISGPNVATFVLPAVAFPPEVRSTFHGLSAGSGKVGAVVGTFIYAPLADAFGIAMVMWIQCALCLVGVGVSLSVCLSLSLSLSLCVCVCVPGRECRQQDNGLLPL